MQLRKSECQTSSELELIFHVLLYTSVHSIIQKQRQELDVYKLQTNLVRHDVLTGLLTFFKTHFNICRQDFIIITLFARKVPLRFRVSFKKRDLAP